MITDTTGAWAHTRMTDALARMEPADPQALRLAHLVRLNMDDLPLPAQGATLQRWQVLCAVAEHDLSLAKLYEGHTDALAVQAEVAPGLEPIAGATWGMWASEAPGARTLIESKGSGAVRLNGRKAWCSGAADLSHGLLTAWADGGTKPQLVRVAMRQPGVSVSRADWHAVGMAASTSLTVSFHDAVGQPVGDAGAYLQRPGFWHGGAGIAACWYGGALTLAHALRHTLVQALPANPKNVFGLCALGKVDVALRSTAALLHEAAQWMDDHPTRDASAVALRVRLAAERTAALVLDEVGRAMGATPFCRERRFAQMAADLPVFVRQSHAERDFAALAERNLASGEAAWAL